MAPLFSLVLLAASLTGTVVGECPDYLTYSQERHTPLSTGKYALSYMRPSNSCRTFHSADVESVIQRMNESILDADLFRIFENSYPNTLDTAIKWKGYAANNSEEELTFVITGDINAMWLRDSSNQMQSYLSVLKADDSPDSLASLYRGVLNLQARYLLTSPFCNSFQPPVESGIDPAINGAATDDIVKPSYSNNSVFECKSELDSLAAFLELSSDYHTATNDTAFFAKFQWLSAVQAVMNTAKSMMTPTYADDGKVLDSPYTFTRLTTRASETLYNDGLGSPVAAGTGLIRSAFRPSDDSTVFQLFIPGNMMFSRYLASTAEIVAVLGAIAPGGLAGEMRTLAASVAAAVDKYGVVMDPNTGNKVYAYEVDGFGSSLVMDDANIPSLLSAPVYGYTTANSTIYQNTRSAVLERCGPNGNPYFMRGPIINAVGGPHNGPGFAWPMASIVRILTSDDDEEIEGALREIVSSTDGLGLIHESINSWNGSDWTRPWFSWANGLFGQMVLDLGVRKPGILKMSFQ